jgi:hypothetical protein
VDVTLQFIESYKGVSSDKFIPKFLKSGSIVEHDPLVSNSIHQTNTKGNSGKATSKETYMLNIHLSTINALKCIIRILNE